VNVWRYAEPLPSGRPHLSLSAHPNRDEAVEEIEADYCRAAYLHTIHVEPARFPPPAALARVYDLQPDADRLRAEMAAEREHERQEIAALRRSA